MPEKSSNKEAQEYIDNNKRIDVLKLVPADNWWVALDFGNGSEDDKGQWIDVEPVMSFAWCRSTDTDGSETYISEEMLPILQNKACGLPGEYGMPYNSDYADHGKLVAMWRGDKEDNPYEKED